MQKLLSRVRTALSRGVARADTLVATAALFFAGRASANGRWALAVILGVAGIVFVVSTGDFAWRKGFVAGKRSIGGAP